MTTVAYKDGIMVCDSSWTDSTGLVSTLQTKITRLRSGALLGEAGDNDSRELVAALQDVKKSTDIPFASKLSEMKIDYLGLLVLPNGEVWAIDITRDQTVEEAYHAGAWKITKNGFAIGSGSQLAIGAMRAGKSAKEAVHISAAEDPNTKLPTHEVPLLPIPEACNGRRKRALR